MVVVVGGWGIFGWEVGSVLGIMFLAAARGWNGMFGVVVGFLQDGVGE
jgi:hypothetical protein